MGEENQAANLIFKIIIDRDNGEGFDAPCGNTKCETFG